MCFCVAERVLRAATSDGSPEIQVTPTQYLIDTERSQLQIYDDSACVSNSEMTSAVCSSGGENSPRLIDSDLGLDSGNPEENAASFYQLFNPSLPPHSLSWLEFTFNETFTLKNVKIHYYCYSADLNTRDLNITLQCIEGSNSANLDLVGDPSLHCQIDNAGDRQVLNIQLQENQLCAVRTRDNKVGLTVKIQRGFKLYVSEIQFFGTGEDCIEALPVCVTASF